MVRSKTSIEPGVENLVNAHNLIPDSTELMVKLSAVLFQESGKAEDILKCKQLLDQAIQKDPKLSAAYLLKGKILYK